MAIVTYNESDRYDKFFKNLKAECWLNLQVKEGSRQQAIMDTLNPLIREIAALRADYEKLQDECSANKFARVDGRSKEDPITVPGTGPILSLEIREGHVYATRLRGEEKITWVAALGAWHDVSMWMEFEQTSAEFEQWWEENKKQYMSDACHMSELHMASTVWAAAMKIRPAQQNTIERVQYGCYAGYCYTNGQRHEILCRR